jgi:hypothetical protein
MIDKIQLTLYEIFGYFLPGSLGSLALLVFYWALCIPTVPIPVYKVHPDSTAWVILVGVSYLMGHLAQGLGNKFLRGAENGALGQNGTIATEIRTVGRNRAAELMGVNPETLDPESLFRFADEFSVQKGLSGDRDIFVYREGFYKGCTISMAMLCVALLLRAIFDGTTIRMPEYVYVISREQIFTAAVLVAIAARICKARSHRFGAYRVTRAFFAFLVLSQPRNEQQ